MANQPTLVSLSHRFAALLRGLRSAVIGRGHQTRLPRPLLDAVHQRLTSMIARFERLLARATAAPHNAPPKPRRADLPRAERPYRPDPVPRHHAWLLRLVPPGPTEPHPCAPHRAAIEQFLSDPAMRAAIEQNPALHPLLRALCHMLGLPRPTHLPPPTPQPSPTPPRPRKPRRTPPSRPSPFPTPPRPPTPWDQRRAFHAMFGPPRFAV